MTNLTRFLLEGTIASSLVILSALVITQLLRRRASAKSVYAAWAAVLMLVLTLPFLPEFTKPVVTLDGARVSRAMSAPALGRLPMERGQTAALPAASAQTITPADTAPQTAQSKDPTQTLSVGAAVSAVYLAGALGALMCTAIRHMRFMRLARRWQRPVSKRETLCMFAQIKRRMGIKRSVRLYVCAAADGPMLVGVLRPRVLLPDETLAGRELALVLQHELTHFKRRDLWFKAAQALCACLHWFNPLVYLMNRCMNYACESACDERVMRGADMQTRQCYSETIIAVIRRRCCPRTALSTSFYGGKKGMKNRIFAIMDTSARRLGALMLCLVLALSVALSGAVATQDAQSAPRAALTTHEPVDTAAALPMQAVIACPNAPSANLCMGATSYDYAPQGTYFNGAEVTILELSQSVNNVPELAAGENVYWAQVQIGGAVTGWMPLPCLTPADGVMGARAELPEAAVNADGGNVYASNDASAPVIAALQKNESVRVLGRLRDFWHIQTAGGLTGFVAADALKFNADGTQALVSAALPALYDYVQPGQQERFRAYQEQVDAYWQKYGDSNDWPLDVRAEVSRLTLESGFYWADDNQWVNLVPGEGDLSAEQAAALADAQAMELFGMSENTYLKRTMFYYYVITNPETRIWHFRYYAVAGAHDCAIKLDQNGNLLESWQDTKAQRTAEDVESGSDRTQIDYYITYGYETNPTPGEEAMRESVLNRAWTVFAKEYDRAGDIAQYDLSAVFYKNQDASLRWWRVDIVNREEYSTVFHVAFVLGEQPAIISTTALSYEKSLKDADDMMKLEELTALRGAFYTWTLEEKADMYPDWCTLPDENALPKEQALEIAQGFLRSEYGFGDADIAAWHPFYFFTLETLAGSETREGYWRVDFYSDEAMAGDMLNGYTVIIHPVTGEVVSFWGPDGNG